jgi:hypothetical protein
MAEENSEAKFSDKFDNLYICHPAKAEPIKIPAERVILFDPTNMIAVVIDDDGDEMCHCGMAMTAEKLKAK